MAGQGKKTFVAGEVLLAQDVNDFLMDQSVMNFATSAARSSAIPTPTEGMVTYLADSNAVQVYNGAAFVGVGKVLQVVSTNTGYDAGTTVSTATYTATGNTATITPSSATSKILVIVSQGNRKTNADSQTEVQSRLYRNGSAINTNVTYNTCYTNSSLELRLVNAITFLDSPATTSATTYTMYGSATAGSVSFDFFNTGSMTLMEISV